MAVVPKIMVRAYLGWRISGLLLAAQIFAGCASAPDDTLLGAYDRVFRTARYIDLTHAFAPGDPAWPGFGRLIVSPAKAAMAVPGFIKKDEEFSYYKHGAGITAYVMPTDQVGTQLDPPAHGNSYGATISDIPASVTLRPLVIIDVSAKVAADPGYVATSSDVLSWEKRFGRIPEGSVVMFRTDWSHHWHDPQRFTAAPFPGIDLDALQFLHLKRKILFHGHEPLDTDATPDRVAETWLLTHDYMQAEGVANLDQAPEHGALIAIGFAKPEGGTGGLARLIAIAPANWRSGVTIDESPGAPLPRQARELARSADKVLRPGGGGAERQ